MSTQQQAEALLQQGQTAQAERICLQLLATHPNAHQIQHLLSKISLQIGSLPRALTLLSQATRAAPKEGLYFQTLCEAHRLSGNTKDAIHAGKKAARLRSNDANSHYQYGLALMNIDAFQQAANCFRQALRIAPNNSILANNLGAALDKFGHIEDAIAAYQHALQNNPNNVVTLNNLAKLQLQKGQVDDARQTLIKTIDLEPHHITAHFRLSGLKKYTEEDPHVALLEDMQSAPNIFTSDELTCRYWFALGKARSDIKQYDKAFQAFKTGNTIRKQSFQFNIANTHAISTALQQRFTKAFLNHTQHIRGYRDNTPIFIVGMPRSGTTLTEQILCSHSQIYGAGELKTLYHTLEKFSGQNPEEHSFMDWLEQANSDDVEKLGKHYIKQIRHIEKHAPHITDKLPGNIFNVGLIHKALPNAKIIYTTRHPMDTCLSIYTKLFDEPLAYSCDLDTLGQYYNISQELMHHWINVLPVGSIMEANYESIVDDLETNARKLIAFCGLEWEDTCLEFHKNTRIAQTASREQVQKPIYKSSVATWKPYEQHLEPLKNSLGIHS